jgi:predicted kinase
MAQSSTNKSIVLVAGKVCSGKGRFCPTQYPGYHHITVSDVVRRIANTNVRSKLSDTGSLDTLIINELVKEIDQHEHVVIDGIRQVSIINALTKRYRVDDMVWLDVPEAERRRRFAARASSKDDVSFDDASAGDAKLGIDGVETVMRSVGRVVSNM